MSPAVQRGRYRYSHTQWRFHKGEAASLLLAIISPEEVMEVLP